MLLSKMPLRFQNSRISRSIAGRSTCVGKASYVRELIGGFICSAPPAHPLNSDAFFIYIYICRYAQTSVSRTTLVKPRYHLLYPGAPLALRSLLTFFGSTSLFARFPRAKPFFRSALEVMASIPTQLPLGHVEPRGWDEV